MVKKYTALSILVFLLGIFVLIGFVSAAKAPTNLVFSLNSTSTYDGINGTHGVFALNWTNNTVDSSYLVYMTTNGTDFTGATFRTAANTSGGVGALNPGLLYYNLTDANYTFIVQATDATNSTNSSMAWMTIDGTGPSTVQVFWSTLPTPANDGTNETFKNASATNRAYNTSTNLILNVYVSDASSGLTSSMCLISINATNPINQSVALSSGWCNTTTLSLSGNLDGKRLLQIYVNDTVNNFALNNTNTLYLDIDSTNPTVTVSCSDTIEGESFPCSCSSSDATSGLNSSKESKTSTSDDGTEIPTLTGSFTYTCVQYDYAGNKAEASTTYVISGASSNTGGGGGSGSSSAAATWSYTQAISDDLFQQGYTSKVQAKKRIQIMVNNEQHHVGVVSVGTDKVTIEIASDPFTVDLAVGEDTKVDVDADGFYDVYVLLNGIVDGKADLTILSIHEEVPEGSESESVTTGDADAESEESTGEESQEKSSSSWMWIIIALIVLVAIGWGIAKQRNK